MRAKARHYVDMTEEDSKRFVAIANYLNTPRSRFADSAIQETVAEVWRKIVREWEGGNNAAGYFVYAYYPLFRDLCSDRVRKKLDKEVGPDKEVEVVGHD